MKIKVFINTGFANAKHEDILEIDDEEWESMTDHEKEARLEEEAEMYMENTIEIGAYPLEDGEE